MHCQTEYFVPAELTGLQAGGTGGKYRLMAFDKTPIPFYNPVFDT
jgi:hypothetical protein